MFPQFSTNEFSDTQNRIVSQGPGGQPTQQYTQIPSNSLPPHIVEALSSKFKGIFFFFLVPILIIFSRIKNNCGRYIGSLINYYNYDKI